MLRYFDAFAGISGFRSALEKVGSFECVGFCEIDKYAQMAYRAMYETGGEEFYENIREIDTGKLGDFDLLTGGFPCQPFSLAGRRKSFKDERGDLFFELARILKAKRPQYFTFENVPGLLSAEAGTAYAKILDTLCELGYSVAWHVLNSTDFGVPQSRRRVYLIGNLGERCPCEVLAFGGISKENCRSGKPEQLIGGSQGARVYSPNGVAVTQCSGSGGCGGKTGLYFIDMNPPPNLTDHARCITTRQDSGVSTHKGEHSAVFVDLNENGKVTENVRCLHTRMDLGVTSSCHKGERSGVHVEDEPRAILNPFKETTYQNGRRIKEPNEPMFTLTVSDRHGIIHRGRIRRLMPIECWKLQGFEKAQFEKVQALGISDAQLYKMAGNAVTVNVVEAIARNLLKFDEERKAEYAEPYYKQNQADRGSEKN